MHLAIEILATQFWKISVYRNIPSATFMEMRVLALNNYNYVYKIALGWKRAIILSVSSWHGTRLDTETLRVHYIDHTWCLKRRSQNHILPMIYTVIAQHYVHVCVHWKLHAQSMDTAYALDKYQLGWVYWRWIWIHSRARVKPPPPFLTFILSNR